MAKRVFVDVAAEEIRLVGKQVNTSRIIASTGIHRSEVNKLLTAGIQDEPRHLGIAGRLCSQWEQDKRFQDRSGRPKLLTYGGESNEFEMLVRSVDTHITPGTVLFELERLKLVQKSNGKLKLVESSEDLKGDPVKLFELLAKDITTLIATTEDNLEGSEAHPNLHVVTDYDNVYADELIDIRKFLLEEGKAFHKRLRDYIADRDADISPDTKRSRKAGKRVTIGTFSYADSEDS